MRWFGSAPVASLSAEEAYRRATEGEIQLVDVREANEWAQSRIPGAILAPLSLLAYKAAELPRDKPIVFYCQVGIRSARAVELCRQLGLPHDTHLHGGINAWRVAQLPIDA